jgi:hypothetical protein
MQQFLLSIRNRPLSLQGVIFMVGVHQHKFSTFLNAVQFLLKSGKSPCKNAPGHYCTLPERTGPLFGT